MTSILFSKFDGGKILTCEGELVSVKSDTVVVAFEGVEVKFRRQPGAKCGWGLGPAKAWRLGEQARREHCIPDTGRR